MLLPVVYILPTNIIHTKSLYIVCKTIMYRGKGLVNERKKY